MLWSAASDPSGSAAKCGVWGALVIRDEDVRTHGAAVRTKRLIALGTAERALGSTTEAKNTLVEGERVELSPVCWGVSVHPVKR